MRNRRKFTLLELLVVIGVIAVLASLLLPALQKARSSATAILCLSNQKQVGNGFICYADDYNGYFFPGNGINLSWYNIYGASNANAASLNLGYVNPKVTYCPAGPAIKPNDIWWCYGAPAWHPHFFSYSKLISAGANGNQYIKWGKIGDPARFGLGLADNLGSNGQQRFLLYVDDDGAISMRHNNKANGWFVDGHAEPMFRERILEITKEIAGLTWVKVYIKDKAVITLH